MGTELTMSRRSFLGLRLRMGALDGGLACSRLVVSVQGWFDGVRGVWPAIGFREGWGLLLWA
ncbi:hypothetical protein RHMOL_Rhmol05G0292700 [Rhododendron molle]|nr:hypothetical protein RHMOL_Rhmol05G0292700 [Rhododendron molle]